MASRETTQASRDGTALASRRDDIVHVEPRPVDLVMPYKNSVGTVPPWAISASSRFWKTLPVDKDNLLLARRAHGLHDSGIFLADSQIIQTEGVGWMVHIGSSFEETQEQRAVPHLFSGEAANNALTSMWITSSPRG